ncbi:MAG: AMP-binding enzyme, partial [Acidimicrobiales bacterium]
EVEEVLKTHTAVVDAGCVGMADERFGEAITAIVQLSPGAATSGEELIAHVKDRLASFKAPKSVIFVDSVGRSPSGKLDYKHLRAIAVETSEVPA